MKPLIEINDLGKKYRLRKAEPYLSFRDMITDSVKNLFSKKESKKDFWALKDINLSVQKGERLGVIGKNGAGKSTLLKILSRVTWPTTGHAVIRGRLASLLEVGTGFHPELTGRENIYLNGSILGLKKKEIERQFDAIVDFSGVKVFLDTPLKSFSSGMQLRLAFAVAAHLEPEILLIDEVLAVGDMEFQKKCIRKMKEVSAKDGRTIVFVSHQLNAVAKLCNRAAWLDKGQLIETGPVDEIIQHYTASVQSEPGTHRYARTQNTDETFFRSIEITTPGVQVGGNLELNIQINDKCVNRPFVININVLDGRDELLAHIINEDDAFSTGSINENTLHVVLKQLNLVPGKYYLSFWAGFDMTHQIDAVEKAVSFEIEGLNEFTKRMIPFPSNSKIIIPSQWQAE